MSPMSGGWDCHAHLFGPYQRYPLAADRSYTPPEARAPQYLALLVLWEQDGIAVGSLGERLYLDSGTLTPLLKRLEAAGLVRRERSVEDERRVLVHLTDDGRALRARARGIPRELAGATGCSADEVASLTRQLQQLRSRLVAAAAASAPIA